MNVLKLDKKLNTETRLVTLVAPASQGLTKIDVYANTHSIQSVLTIEATVDATETTYLELNMKCIQDIVSSFGKADNTQPDTITFQHEKGSFRYLIYVARNLDIGEVENNVFAMPYSVPQTYFIEEINKIIKPIEGNNLWQELGVQVQPLDPQVLEAQLKAQSNNHITYLRNQLNGLIPLFKQTGVHVNNTPYIEFSSQRVYMQTLSTLTLYKDLPDVPKMLTGFKMAQDPSTLLHNLTKSGHMICYNDVDKCVFVVKTARGIYVLNYKTALFDYRNTLNLVGSDDWVKVNREDFITKMNRLKLVDGRTEAAFILNSFTKQWQLNLRNPFVEQDILIREADGELFQGLKFNLVPKVLDEVLPPLVNSSSEYLYIYFGRTPEGVWTMRIEDETHNWETYLSIQTFKEHSFKSMKES